MSPEAQIIAIAETCGWTAIKPSNVWWYGLRPGNNGMGDRPGEAVPDFLSDLHAMHEAEKVLIESGKYWSNPSRTGYLDYLIHIAYDLRDHATATQRAEAFLRCTGRWIE